ncbi:CsbD family protein [Burkholderia multivorans]|nr:CsbD family protein [Burkholderia multivorans]
MSMNDKFDNKAQELKGKAKDATGKAIGNEQMKAEGKADQAAAGTKQAGEKRKDTARHVTDRRH